MENKQQGNKTTEAKKTTTTTAPVALTKELMTKMVNEKKGLRAMVAETGQGMYHVKKALNEFGLKTAAMGRGAGKLPFLASMEVFNAIQNGITDYADIAAVTGLEVGVVGAAVKKMMKEGAVKVTIAVAVPTKKASVAPASATEPI